MDCNLHQQGLFQTRAIPSYFSGDINHLNQLGVHLLGHVARAFPEDDRLRACCQANRKPAAGWKIPKGRIRTTWTRSVENDLAPLNIGLHSAQDRTGWRRLESTATLWHDDVVDDDDDIYDSEHRLT